MCLENICGGLSYTIWCALIVAGTYVSVWCDIHRLVQFFIQCTGMGNVISIGHESISSSFESTTDHARRTVVVIFFQIIPGIKFEGILKQISTE